ncbi:RNA polymerase III subunit RPC82 family protein [Perilla frutescens var. frutescens]|nr:RNA polymerase III subunit RPC82 family protein [Perilla frutescens var. frutescens]
MESSSHGILLAVHIISSFHGDLCSKVCECLLRRGTLPLIQIIRYTGLSRENVMACLRILIHHNCVQAFAMEQEGGFGDAPRIVTQYMALFDNMLHKMRGSKFLDIIYEELNKQCARIFFRFLEHGRLSFKQVIDSAPVPAKGCETVRESFRRLSNARFIEHCPVPEPFLALPSEEEPSSRIRGANSAKNAAERQTMEHRALIAAAPMESMRFSIEEDDLFEEKGKNTNSLKVGEKRKQDVLKLDESTLDPNRKKEVLWRVNFEEFVYLLRHKACISYVQKKINNDASIALSAIFSLSRQLDTRKKAENSAYVPVSAVYDGVRKAKADPDKVFKSIRTALDHLGCQSLWTDMDGSYSVDIEGIIGMARKEEVETVVLKRYGREAYMIFRMLSKADCFVETKKILAHTLFEEKVGVVKLHKLWIDEYLHMEKVDAGAKYGFLLWKINQQLLGVHFLDEMYHAALNLRLRVAHELHQGKELLEMEWKIEEWREKMLEVLKESGEKKLKTNESGEKKLKTKELGEKKLETNESSKKEVGTVFQWPKEKLEKLRKENPMYDRVIRNEHLKEVRELLESNLMNLDDVIMLFHDF